jgi:hypothetical protein
MRALRIPLRALVPAVVSLALLSACSRQNPTAPVIAGESDGLSRMLSASVYGQQSFFPLAIGNRWHAASDDHVATIPSGGGPPIDEMTIHTDITRDLTGTEEISGLVYTLMRETLVSTSPANPGGSTYTTWVRYRQDANGLYESDVTGPPASSSVVAAAAAARAGAEFPASLRARVPAARVVAYEKAWEALQRKIVALRNVVADPLRATDVASGEITRLDYPLHPGASWTIREDPHFRSTVEGLDQLSIPAGRFNAYRIRIDSQFFGPEDTVHLWMSRSGQLQFLYRLVEPATDEEGNVIGEFVATHDEVVDAVLLVR